MNRRIFLKSTTAATTWLCVRTSTALNSGAAAIRSDDLLAEARQRIEKNRRGDGIIQVRDGQGNRIANATVKVDQLWHDFLFGSNAFMLGRTRDPDLEKEYRRHFEALLNYATLGFYWGAYEPVRGKPDYEYTDTAAEWCLKNGITLKGHPLAWDHPASSPRWLPNDPKEIEQLSVARVREIVERFRGRIDKWDVVNEPTDLTRFKNPMNTWAVSLGAVPFSKLHFRVARAANPKATFLVNDYRTDPAYHRIASQLLENGKPIFDAIGIQSHMHRGGWKLPRIWEVCDRFADFRVPLHFTETTVVSGTRSGSGENWNATDAKNEAKQADYVPQFYTMLFAHPAVQAITWWDFADLGAWQGAAAGWLRRDMSPKPVYDRLKELIKNEWWTNAKGRTNVDGEFATRAFYGTHRLTIETPDRRRTEKQIHWESGGRNRFELTVA